MPYKFNNFFMTHLFCRYFVAVLLFISISSMQLIYSIDCSTGKSDIFVYNKSGAVIFYELYVSHVDDTLNQAKSSADTLGGKIRLVKEINGIKIYQYVSSGYEQGMGDSLLLESGRKNTVEFTARKKKTETDDFEILPYPAYSNSNPIPADVNLPDGLIFRIQLGAFSKQVSNGTFKGLSPVSYEVVNGKFKYYTGIFYSSESAGRALKDIREYGFSDSFLVSFYNGIIISMEKAREIEYSQIKL